MAPTVSMPAMDFSSTVQTAVVSAPITTVEAAPVYTAPITVDTTSIVQNVTQTNIQEAVFQVYQATVTAVIQETMLSYIEKNVTPAQELAVEQNNQQIVVDVANQNIFFPNPNSGGAIPQFANVHLHTETFQQAANTQADPEFVADSTSNVHTDVVVAIHDHVSDQQQNITLHDVESHA